ncbi:MAG: DUF86 domain-containing protein [Euryarchaeota archaeon]|nr:DUF86 domain-containing protein [Euryarchaeota archaeon]
MSKRNKEDIELFLDDIIEASSRISTYIKYLDSDVFMKDIMIQDAVIRNFEIVGEAVKNLPQNFREEYSYVNWRGASGMRDKLIHGYFGVDLSILWSTAKKDLPLFSKEIIKIREIIIQPEKKK